MEASQSKVPLLYVKTASCVALQLYTDFILCGYLGSLIYRLQEMLLLQLFPGAAFIHDSNPISLLKLLGYFQSYQHHYVV